MGTPADRVPPSLLRHLHLIVNKSFPRQPHPSIDFVMQILSQAPELTQHQATMTWRFLSEPPQDGESKLIWQPPQMGTEFASDGYVWVDSETVFVHDVKGQALEVYLHRSGLRPGQEQMATHSRRRYRLKQNPSLWLVCYHQAEQRDFRTAQTISIDSETRRILSERQQIERNKSQLVRQEFMLHDTAKFPNMSVPGAGGHAPFAQQPMGYPGNVMAHMNRGQYNPYLQQQQQQAMAAQAAQSGFGPSPSKRPRHGSTAHASVSMTSIPMAPGMAVGPVKLELAEEVTEENESTGADLMDILTPRDIALERYKQHHEWLEEILSSPFDTHRIVPPVLGLGRKGELESLTKDFFDAPMSQREGKMLPDPDNVTPEIAQANLPVVDEVPINRVGKLEGNKAEDFTKRATDRVAAINAEMEMLKKQHARRMAKLSRGFAYKDAEQKVRVATLELINGKAEEIMPTQAKGIEELQMSLEQKEGKAIDLVAIVECTEKGGQEELQQKSLDEAQESEDFDMTGTDAFDLDGAQLQTPSEPAAQSDVAGEQPTTQNDPVAVSQIQEESEPPSVPESGGMQATQPPQETVDVAAEDYVMVRKEDVSALEANEPVNVTEPLDYLEPVDPNGSAGDLPDFGDGQQENFDTNDFGGDSIDFGDMDTAGDELSGYAQEIVNMGAETGHQSDPGLNSPPTAGPLPGATAPSEPSNQSSL